MEVGEQLKKIREIHGLSQRELAKRVGLTNSTISMIERNTVSPSINSLSRILAGVSMSISDFFRVELSPPEKVVYLEHELLNIADQRPTIKQVGTNESPGNVKFLIKTYQARCDSGSQMAIKKGIETGTVINGAIELTVAGSKYKLAAGDSYQFSTLLPHRFFNKTANDCKIVCVHDTSSN